MEDGEEGVLGKEVVGLLRGRVEGGVGFGEEVGLRVGRVEMTTLVRVCCGWDLWVASSLRRYEIHLYYRAVGMSCQVDLECFNAAPYYSSNLLFLLSPLLICHAATCLLHNARCSFNIDQLKMK